MHKLMPREKNSDILKNICIAAEGNGGAILDAGQKIGAGAYFIQNSQFIILRKRLGGSRPWDHWTKKLPGQLVSALLIFDAAVSQPGLCTSEQNNRNSPPPAHWLQPRYPSNALHIPHEPRERSLLFIMRSKTPDCPCLLRRATLGPLRGGLQESGSRLRRIRFDILGVELDEFSPVGLVDADQHFGPQFLDFIASNGVAHFELGEGFGNDFTFRKVAARLYDFLKEVPIFVFERYGYRCHVGLLYL
jgi:hypothetical protein